MHTTYFRNLLDLLNMMSRPGFSPWARAALEALRPLFAFDPALMVYEHDTAGLGAIRTFVLAMHRECERAGEDVEMLMGLEALYAIIGDTIEGNDEQWLRNFWALPAEIVDGRGSAKSLLESLIYDLEVKATAVS